MNANIILGLDADTFSNPRGSIVQNPASVEVGISMPQQSQNKQFSIAIPNGVVAGNCLTVNLPNGQQTQVVVPPGYSAGMKMTINYKATSQPPQQQQQTFTPMPQPEVQMAPLQQKHEVVVVNNAKPETKELRRFLDSLNLVEYFDKIVADGVECTEDLVHLSIEDLMEYGLKKIKAKKTLAAFAIV